MSDPSSSNAAPGPPEKSAFFPRVEALRGLAALAVAGFHAGQTSISVAGRDVGQADGFGNEGAVADGLAWVWRMVFNGHGAVVLFFVISGFVLRLSLERSSGATGEEAYPFFVRRLLRLYPAVFATVAIFAGLYYVAGAMLPGVATEAYEPLGLLRNALLLSSSINGVTWTLQVELIGSLLVFCAWLAIGRVGEGALLVGFAVLLGLSFAKTWAELLYPIGFGSIGALYAFLAGMLAAGSGRSWAASLSSRRSGLLVAFSAAAFLLARPTFGFASTWSVVVEAVSGGCLLAGLAFGRDSVLGPFLEGPLVRFYGRISYSFYLLHPLTLIVLWTEPEAIGRLYRSWFPGVAISMLLFVASTAVVTPLAWLSYRYIEKPAMDLGRHLTRPGEAAGRGSLVEG